MKRVEYFKDYLNMNKYILKEEYNGYGIYQEKCPSGYFVHQSYLIKDKKDNRIIIHSYMNICYDEVLDMIDNHIETGKYGYKAIKNENDYILHNSGNLI